MSDRPRAGDIYVVVDEMPSGGTWGHPLTVNPDTWLVKVEPVLIVTDDWTPVDSLPEGRYAVVRLEGNDE